MRTFILLFCTTVFSITPNNIISQNIKILIEEDKTLTVNQVFDIIDAQTDYSFIYPEYLFNDAPRISLKKGKMSVSKLLQQIVVNGDFNLTITKDNTIIIKQSPQQDILKLKGKVTDTRGMPIPGVNVIIKSYTVGIATDFDGTYSLNVRKNDIIVFSALSFKTQEIKIEGQSIGADGYITIDVQLQDDVQSLDEVLIVSNGYKELVREKESGAYVSVSGKQLESQITNDVLSTLEGFVPGLSLNKDTSTTPAIFIRGIGSFGNVTPLFVIDGQPVSQEDLNLINPQDIDNVTVLKDAAAASIYGSGAANGVIVISTKRGKGAGSKPVFNFRNSVQYTARPSLSYFNNMDSRETIEYQRDNFNSTIPQRNINTLFPRAYDAFFSNLAYINNNDNDPTNDIPDDPGINTATMNARLDNLASYNNTKDLEKGIFNNKFQYLSNLSFSGQTNKLNYYGALALDKTEGQLKNETFQRVNALLNADYNFAKNTVLELSINYTKADNETTPFSQGDYNLTPYEKIYDENGNPATNVRRKYSDEAQNRGLELGTKNLSYSLLNVLNDETHENEQSNSRYNLALTQKNLLDGLSATVRFQYLNNQTNYNDLFRANSFYTRNLTSIYRNIEQYDTFDPDTFQFITVTEVGPQVVPDGDILKKTFDQRTQLNTRFQLDYDKSFNNGNHYITASAGVERRNSDAQINVTTFFGYNEGNLLFIPIDQTIIPQFLFTGSRSTSTYFRDQKFFDTSRLVVKESSLYLNVNYSLLKKYNFNLSTRRDRSSTFSNGKQYLGSVGFKWNIHKENFINADWLNGLDFRATWGVVGNSAAISEASLYLVTYPNINTFTNVQGLDIQFPANKDLTFEVVETTNLGLDFRLFNNNRIVGSFDIYRKKSSDVLSIGPINATHGFKDILKNTADITNEGIELGLTTKNIVTSNFNWTSQISYATFRNDVDKTSFNFASDALAARPRNLAGYATQTIWAYDWAGLNDQGQAMAYYTNDAGERVTTTNREDVKVSDLVVMGTAIPTTNIGFANTFRYKGLQLFARFAYNGGNIIGKESVVNTFNASSTNAINRSALGYWKAPGDEASTNVPSLPFQSDINTQLIRNNATISYTDGDYIKLRQVALSYNLNSNQIKNTPFTAINIALQGDNLWYWAKNNEGIDPEFYNALSKTRNLRLQPTYSVRVALNF